MPDILTHVLFARQVKNMLEDKNVTDVLDTYSSLYYFGAQGPDFLYYYLSPLIVDRRVQSAGSMMHTMETAKFFKHYIEHLELLSGTDYERNLAYFIGFMTHYFCDKSVHPYVFASEEQGIDYFTPGQEKVFLTHAKIETLMDVKLWPMYTHSAAYKQDILQIIGEPFGMDTAEIISSYINSTQPNVVSKNEVMKAASSMRTVLKILYDPKHRKKWLLNMLPIPKKPYPAKDKEELDVLNINKRTWRHADSIDSDSHYFSDMSVEELMEQGAQECTVCLDEIIMVLEKGIEIDLDTLIPNQSYLSGLDIS